MKEVKVKRNYKGREDFRGETTTDNRSMITVFEKRGFKINCGKVSTVGEYFTSLKVRFKVGARSTCPKIQQISNYVVVFITFIV
ncbi:MAG: hypothetical protein NTW14_00300 [bacterium]|nr:hypothetical protein [bacterium]